MLVYRISSPQYINDLSGHGAKLYGGRWNDKGTAVVYFASSRAMAIMELLVHLRPGDLVRDYSLAVFDVPEDKILVVSTKDLPENWRSEEHEKYLRQLGKQFVNNNDYLLMEVPSALVEEEHNFIMNPAHDDANQVKLISQRIFKFDNRLKN
ncbi:RES family NAD+ phosphorylase [Pedobacter sp. ASV28]|uniref:RES family NAD+ phosphorylase n=1 Tax=Pedobacter sp. ASV28 TaxID=2795123 RepID=UPI0018EAA64C|nr:RES family NAD+ phosphorylase [Pedobacter sp. ASV28]